MSVYGLSRRRRRLRLLIPLAGVVVLAVLVYVLVDQRVVVPGVTARLYPIHYRDGIERVAEQYQVDPYLVAAVVRTESGYDPEAVSRVGAVGLMQLMPATAEWIVQLDRWKGRLDPELTDPDDNLELGTCYLAYLLERFGEDRRAAVAAYNAGQGTVLQWLAAADGARLALDDVLFPETRAFVERVEEFVELYHEAHPDIFGGGTARV